ncbi:MAG: hypothetical protein GY928_18780 [Colwellia sp.]|nr:hypothetical protein [Colwellia sp.]
MDRCKIPVNQQNKIELQNAKDRIEAEIRKLCQNNPWHTYSYKDTEMQEFIRRLPPKYYRSTQLKHINQSAKDHINTCIERHSSNAAALQSQSHNSANNIGNI